MKMTVEEALSHAGPLVTGHIWERIKECLPSYIWMWGRGDEKSGVCSHCHEVLQRRENLMIPDFAINDPYVDELEQYPFATQGWNHSSWPQAEKPIHGARGYCPACGARVTYRDMARGHESLCDRLYFIDWRKSAAEKDVLVMVGYEVQASWKKHLHEWLPAAEIAPEMTVEPCVICVFHRGRRGQRFMRKWVWEPRYDAEVDGRIPVTGRLTDFVRAWQCNDKYMPFGKCGTIPYYRHRGDFRNALEDTWWGGIGEAAGLYEERGSISRILEIQAISAAPCTEYLVKLGMGDLAKTVICTDRYDACPLNLKGKNVCSVLGISPDAWGWLKGHGKIPDAAYLKIAHLMDEKKIRMSQQEIWNLSRVQTFFGMNAMLSRCRDTGHMRKCARYILKKGIGAHDYADHLGMLEKLGIPVLDEEMAFPNAFRRIHGALSQRVKIQADKEAEEKLAAFRESLKGYCFSAFGLVLNPIPTIQDVVKEGQALHHCVGTYAGRYASGQTILCTLREENALHAPLYTVEISIYTGSMVQCRGDHNRIRPADEDRLSQFWRLFDMMRRDAAAGNRPKGKGRAA